MNKYEITVEKFFSGKEKIIKDGLNKKDAESKIYTDPNLDNIKKIVSTKKLQTIR
jgi:hypothetical protein